MNLLEKIKKEDVVLDPFPHIVMRDVLPPHVVSQLISEMPPLSVLAKGKAYASNQRFSYSYKDIEEKPDLVSPLWHEFVSENAGAAFFKDFVRIFGEILINKYPVLGTIPELSNFRVGKRAVDTFGDVDVVLDAQICVNTPVTEKPTSVKISHIDDSDKLFSGLFYLRTTDDTSEGGDLYLYTKKKASYKLHGPRLIDDKYVEKVLRVPYASNTLVIFVNSLDAIHGVSPRLPTSYPRYFLNLVGEVENPLFDLAPHWENIFEKMLRKGKKLLV